MNWIYIFRRDHKEALSLSLRFIKRVAREEKKRKLNRVAKRFLYLPHAFYAVTHTLATSSFWLPRRKTQGCCVVIVFFSSLFFFFFCNEWHEKAFIAKKDTSNLERLLILTKMERLFFADHLISFAF